MEFSTVQVPQDPARKPATSTADLPLTEPTRPVLLWMTRCAIAAWSPHRLGFSALAFLPWALAVGLPIAKPGGLIMLLALLPASLLSTLAGLAVMRSVALELAVDRRRPAGREIGFVVNNKRAAAGVGLVCAFVASGVFALLSVWLTAPAAWAAASALWWMLAALGLASIAADGSDTIDAVQRSVAYALRQPATSVLSLLPVAGFSLGIASLGWVAQAGMLAMALSMAVSSVVVSLLLACAQGAYLALRYANDRCDPAEITDSGSELGVLRTEVDDDAA